MARVTTGKRRKRSSTDEEPRRRKRSSASSSNSKSGRTVIDFSKMEGEGGGRVRVPETEYRGKIVSVKRGNSSDKGTPYMQVDVKIMDDYSKGKHKGKVISDRMYITPKSMYRIWDLCEAVGLRVKKTKTAIPDAKLIGKELGFTAVDDEYEGRIRSRIGDVMDLETLEEMMEDEDTDDDEEYDDEDEEDEEEDEEDEDDEVDEEDEEDEDDEDLEDLDLDEL